MRRGQHLLGSMMRILTTLLLSLWLLLLAGCSDVPFAPIRDPKMIAEFQRVMKLGCFRSVEELLANEVAGYNQNGELDAMLADKLNWPRLAEGYAARRTRMLARWEARPTPPPGTVAEELRLGVSRADVKEWEHIARSAQ